MAAARGATGNGKMRFSIGKSMVYVNAKFDLRIGMRENGGRHPWECWDVTFYLGLVAVNVTIFGLRKFSRVVCALLGENSSRNGPIRKTWPRIENID